MQSIRYRTVFFNSKKSLDLERKAILEYLTCILWLLFTLVYTACKFTGIPKMSKCQNQFSQPNPNNHFRILKNKCRFEKYI